MGMIAAKCTQCGANIEVDETKDAGVCPFCNTAFVTEKAIYQYNLTQNIVVENANMIIKESIEELEKKAYQDIELRGFKFAKKDFVNLIDTYSDNWKFWWGYLICSTENFEKVMDISDNDYVDYHTYGFFRCIKALDRLLPVEEEQKRKELLGYGLKVGVLKYEYEYDVAKIKFHGYIDSQSDVTVTMNLAEMGNKYLNYVYMYSSNMYEKGSKKYIDYLKENEESYKKIMEEDMREIKKIKFSKCDLTKSNSDENYFLLSEKDYHIQISPKIDKYVQESKQVEAMNKTYQEESDKGSIGTSIVIAIIVYGLYKWIFG